MDVLGRAHAHAAEFLARIDESPVAATASLVELRERLGGDVPPDGEAPEKVIDGLVEASRGGHLRSSGGRFFAWVNGGALPSALGADWLVSAWNNNAASYASGPASAVIEEIAGAWVKELLGLPREASFAFTTGTQMAHVTALAAARHRLLADAGWDVARDGLFGAPRLSVFAPEQRHPSVDRALRLLGFGTGALRLLPTGADSRLQPETLEAALRAEGRPAVVILDAADLNVGAVDPFAQLVPIARRHGAWVHIDGAFGLWAAASPRFRHLVEGAGLADSWSADAHKWLNTPKDIGMAIVTDREAHRAAMAIDAPYLIPGREARDAIDWTPEWSRRARGVPVYAAIRELGRSGIAALVERCCDHAAALTHGIAALPGAELVAAPTLNQGLVRFPRGDGADERTDEVIAAINAEGTAYFGGTTWHGRRAMRISVVGWRTGEEDVQRTIDAVARILAQVK